VRPWPLPHNALMQRITFSPSQHLWNTAATRAIEASALARVPPHTLMQRAGLAVARLAMAVAPHARTVWIACGPGNNGGDGLEAALHLQQWGKSPVVTWLGNDTSAPPDALASLARARAAGVAFADAAPAGLTAQDLGIDALLGLGSSRPPEGRLLALLQSLHAGPAPVLAIDLPTGLDADTGAYAIPFIAGNVDRERGSSRFDAAYEAPNRYTLSLLTLKPGLFTGSGRDAAGDIWWDDLGVGSLTSPATSWPSPTAWLNAAPTAAPRHHATHKGSFGDVTVIGGAPGMAGAALLAAQGALHAGAGRVYACLLDPAALAVDPSQPELMLRDGATLDLSAMAVVCGCGGGNAVRTVLPRVLATARQLVLDADALNAIAADPQLQHQLQARGRRWPDCTVLTPHPLEAARLLGSTAAAIQADRLGAATQMANDLHAVVVLKGSGSVIAAPGRVPVINPTGNAHLATAGTGDVLAGLIGARLGQGRGAFDAACAGAYLHGQVAEAWPGDQALTASALARALTAA
jgi:hydroxyethylthiazole kinase-like uncharacterized protein yjeF